MIYREWNEYDPRHTKSFAFTYVPSGGINQKLEPSVRARYKRLH
jgi:hypothetical protein